MTKTYYDIKIETLKGIDALSQASFSYIKNMQTLEILDL